ncbi:hypothetical protein [Pseudomonas sp. SLFW]|uniref:hypothetical protein n=1 Tax=Pseudomonas sp. SLFW TaxID=2683259 RepID=UPI0014131584|nr:hypothetical protein [Pseudomonas sp. SLFW]NBB08489.1 hypothetical protein [Pseudomonas sp. SLFW]
MLIDFMGAMSEGIQDHLPEGQRNAQLTVDEVVARWVDAKSYWAIRSLELDFRSYIKKHEVGDYSVDQILSDFDLLFIWDRFEVEEVEWLAETLAKVRNRVAKTKRSYFNDVWMWIRRHCS